jgi:DNA-binding transcriptional regulator/RsmH inhibitor MraZ
MTTPLFTGSFSRKLDQKGRVRLPAAFLPPPSEDQIFVGHPGRNGIHVVPHSTWLAKFHRLYQEKQTDSVRRDLRLMSRNSWQMKIDAQGRIALPVQLLRSMSFDSTVTLTGMGTYFAIACAEVEEG